MSTCKWTEIGDQARRIEQATCPTNSIQSIRRLALSLPHSCIFPLTVVAPSCIFW